MNTGSTWRQLIKLDNIDGCLFLNGMETLPLFEAVRQYYSTYFPNFPTRCPIQPGNYTAYNVTATDNRNGNPGEHLITKMSPVPFPNGLYRYLIRIYVDGDDIGVTLYWHSRIDVRMNDDKF